MRPVCRVAELGSLALTMRSAIPLLVLALLTVCFVSCKSTRDPIANWTPREGFQYLIVARQFSLGGVGITGDTSTGEYAYRAVLRGKNAADIFKMVLSPGARATEEGKLYALCGIRATDRPAFEHYASMLADTNAEVTTQSGCIVGSAPASRVVKQIADGVYDVYIFTR